MTIQSQTICFTRYPHWHIAASANLSPGDEQPIAWRHCLKLNGRSIASYSNFATQMTGEPPYCALAQAEW